MKKLIIFIVVFLLLIAGAYISLYKFLNSGGRDFLTRTIGDKYDTEVTLDTLEFRFPFKLCLKGFNCGDVAFSRVAVDLVGVNLLKKRVVLDNVYLENLKVKVSREGTRISISPFIKDMDMLPNPGKTEASLPVYAAGVASQTGSIGVRIKEAELKNASIYFEDNTMSPPLKFSLDNLNLKIKDFTYPWQGRFSLDLGSSLKTGDIVMKDLVSALGWIDMERKDLDLNFLVKGFDYASFEEYYPPFWKLRNLDIARASLSLQGLAKSRENNMVIDATLFLDEIEFSDTPENSSKVRTVQRVISIFSQGGEASTPSFHFPLLNSKMDELDIDFSLILAELKDRAKSGVIETVTDILNLPSEVAEPAVGAIKSVFDTIKGVLDKPSSEDTPQDSE